ncbi:unnamed protein product [Tetraodon nigroviridis]|uniref:(spotted green pufferfish) hypothetical protein n=1 Tax=Tetraodon nigroviridis TaxID=99883 RepID=Q4RPW4_TETNG|nr:unnamed protein product [Tetraodon nigroviridis]
MDRQEKRRETVGSLQVWKDKAQHPSSSGAKVAATGGEPGSWQVSGDEGRKEVKAVRGMPTSCLISSECALSSLLCLFVFLVVKSPDCIHRADIKIVSDIVDDVTDRSVRAVAENCPELQFVGFMGCPVTSQGVIHLTASCLPTLSVITRQPITNHETARATKYPLFFGACMKTPPRGETDQARDITNRETDEGCVRDEKRGGKGDKGETKAQRRFEERKLRNLNVLDLRHISELNNETVMEVVRKCRNLSSLNLCLNWSIDDRIVRSTLLWCVEIIAKEGRSLKELYLVSCKITDHGRTLINQLMNNYFLAVQPNRFSPDADLCSSNCNTCFVILKRDRL